MRLFFRILKIIAVLIITLTVVLFSASFLMQDKVAGIILRSFNKSISTKYEFESARLSFLRKFPNASLDLKNVIVHSSPGFDKSAFPGFNTDTLLTAKSVFIEFSITDIFNGIYNIERIGVKEGLLKLFTDTAGIVNYDITVETGKKTGNDFSLDLNRISVKDIKVYYSNLAIKLEIAGIVENGNLKSRISEDEIDFTAVSSLQVTDFRLCNTRIAGAIPAEVDINLQSDDNGIVFNKGSLKFDNYLFSVKGFISSDNLLDLSLTGENFDIQGIKKFIPEGFLKKIDDYDPAGVLQISSTVKGLMSRTSYPGIEIEFVLNDGSVTLIDKTLGLYDVTLSGLFTNGSGQSPETTLLTINNFKGKLGSAEYSGSLSISNFDTLYGTLQLKGKIIPSELKDFFRIKAISSSKGYIDLNLKMEGALPRREKYSFQDFMDLDPDIDLAFNSFSIGLKNDRILVSRINGNLSLKDSVTANDLRFEYKDNKFAISGIFKKLPEWLAGKPEILVASASVRCDHLMPEFFFTPPSAADSAPKREKAYSFPSDIILDLRFVVDTLSFRQFNATKISGSLSYKPGFMNFKTLRLNSLDGTISCNGFIAQNSDKSLNARGNFDLEEININSAFRAFNNFGQDFLKAENLNGNLSGSLSLLLPADSLWKIDIKSINGEGKYILTNGALINFEPVKQLSAFIELSELENISFEKLENDFFIRNNFLYFPQMDVNSSAADLSVNGKHNFDNDYEYHVKILLSEILSKKLKKPRPNTTEFGAIKDDGLGRTSVLLKIENKGKDMKVGYDVKAAGTVIKNDIRTERQTLKTILNEEYGWFKDDTTVLEKPSATTPRFKITWDETDTLRVEKEEEQPEKTNVLKNLLKKKRQ